MTNAIFQSDPTCFQPTFQAARHDVLARGSRLPASLKQHEQAWRHPKAGPEGEPLYLDWLQLGANPYPEQVVVLTSATHGVEGFAGSAIQCQFLSGVEPLLRKRPELGVGILHGLNPWGFAWLRRYDHEGIDLNRNFVDFSRPLPDNPDYVGIHADLFEQPARSDGDVLRQWRRHWGDSHFETVVTQGQYAFPDGLFFGGTRPCWSRRILEEIAAFPLWANARRIAVIDLHTGLGPYGHGEIINDHLPDSAGFNHARAWYGYHARAAMLGESFSPPKTGLVDYFWHELIGERGCFVTLEFGTFSLTELLEALCAEQRYQNHVVKTGTARNINCAEVQALQRFFNPDDAGWCDMVLFRGQQVITMALNGVSQ
jgi:hypothetical protein